jgi:hypothetical protein
MQSIISNPTSEVGHGSLARPILLSSAGKPEPGVTNGGRFCGEGAPPLAEHQHEYRFAYTSKHATDKEKTDCDRPSWLRCTGCPERILVKCGAANEGKCGPCGQRHRYRVARIGREGGKSRLTGAFFVTLTAPGAVVLPWDRLKCTHAANLRCSGEHGCKVQLVKAAEWNTSAPQRWSWFVEYLRREFPGTDVQYWKSWEVQSRGMLHAHFLLDVPGASDERVAEVVARLSIAWGFGEQTDVQRVLPCNELDLARKAGYIASYATKGGDRAPMFEKEPDGEGELRITVERGYRTWSAGRRWGLKMSQVKAQERAWSVAMVLERIAVERCRGDAPNGGGGATGDALLELEIDIYTGAVVEDAFGP